MLLMPLLPVLLQEALCCGSEAPWGALINEGYIPLALL